MKITPTKTIDELINALSYVIDVEGNKKLYHAWRVAILANNFAFHNLKARQRRDIFYASLLHDLGAVGLTKHIIHFLKEEGKPNQNILLSHPLIGAQMVSNLPNINPVSKLIVNHHEWFNGAGYPMGIKRKDIPQGAQFIRIADYLDIAMRRRPHIKWGALEKKIMHQANKQFPRSLAQDAVNALKKDGFFYALLDSNNIPEIFHRIKANIEPIYMPKGIDAIGKTLEMVAQVVDMKHPFTTGHSVRVARYALAISLAMKLTHDDVTRIKWAGLIHDIGKLSIPRKILDKPTRLSPEEFTRIKKHPEMTEKIMDMIPTLKDISEIACGHHEYFNGSGYPRGLRGRETPVGARILTLCDAFDAMTSNRPYRNPLTFPAACREIKKLSGIQFDPEITKVALPLFRYLGL